MRSDLLVINKIDLAPYVGASLEVMDRDSRKMRSGRPFLFANLRDCVGLDAIVAWLGKKMKAPAENRDIIVDAHAPYDGHAHVHGDECGEHHGDHQHSHGHSHSHEEGRHH